MSLEVSTAMRILVLYASEHGQTEAVATAIATHLERAGHDVSLRNSRDGEPALTDYDAVLIGSRIQFERAAPRIGRYVRAHRRELEAMPSGLFTVSLGAVAGHDRDGAEVYLRSFLRELGWRPRWTATIGGGLPYLRYGRVLRWLMSRFAAAAGGPVDTRRNHDLTDWDEVARFAGGIASELAALAPDAAPAIRVAQAVVPTRGV